MAKTYVELAFNIPVRREFTYLVPDSYGEPALGSRVIASIGKRSLAGVVVSSSGSPPKGLTEIKEITRVLDKDPLIDEGYLELARWMSEMYLCSLGEALAAMLPGGRRESEPPLLGGDESSIQGPGEIVLSDEQEEAIARIGARPDGLFYLYGITGSGKTEVFLRVAQKTIEEGRGIIYLVPEISLTRQVTRSIVARFGERAAVLHSRLTPSQRLKEWMRVRRGEALFVIGARSAVFAPVPKLGLIVLDEEHEGSYKSGATPRYHARQVAMKRAAMAGARLVMGSATPSLEAHHLMNRGRITRLTLTRRLSGGAMPEVEIVDLAGGDTSISPRLAAEIRATHAEGRQSILFLNRRGFAHFYSCRSCGWQMKSPTCSTNMTYHKGRNLMVCHYTGYTARPPEVCPECGSLDLGFSGFGTERIEEDLARSFPQLRVRRLDSDVVQRKGVLEETIESFRQGEIDLLLGTQMVAKGLNFPGVKLVGVILADAGLEVPDFRSAERTFALIVQVSGRAGRYVADGKVLIQTYRPSHEAIVLASHADVEGFYDRELDLRERLGFPPFTRLIRLVVRGKNRRRVEQAAADIRASSMKLGGDSPGFEMLGPAECPISLLSNNYRVHILYRAKDFRRMHEAISGVVFAYKPATGVHLEVDVDPVSLL